ncbi:MAG: ATP-binding protein [Candidatus Gastranaerophilales bacterium]|nr:ATP-binding protein [Candidatus Gastranaerophilales bacterium]
MKISPVNNTTFGYNVALNKELVKRLKKDKSNEQYNTVYDMNKNCNRLEERIVRLEGPDRKSLSSHETMIESLSYYFIEMKSQLCEAVDELFPDLHFGEEECTQYEEEAKEFDIPESAEGENGPKPAYIWRETLVDGLQMQLFGPEAEFYTKTNSPQKAKASASKAQGANGLLEKFEPASTSPKSLNDVVGLKNVIEDIKDLVVLPLENPEEAQKRKDEYGILIPHFIVMFGPPGCGKTMTSEAIKAQTGCDMYKLDLSRVGTGFVNESSSNVTKAFDFLKEQAKKTKKPVLLFMDEMDAMLMKRQEAMGGDREDNKLVDTLLQHISKAQDNNIIIIGATNMYDLIDPAIKDRAKLELYVGLPDDDERMELLERELTKFKMGVDLARNKDEIKELSIALRPYSPRSIKTLIEGASRIAWRNQRPLIKQDVLDAIERESKDKINEKEYIPKTKNNSSRIGFKA